ncbi:unnamed protein product [Leptidea sinapis]|uniref:Uncharacterized protein n=1 Tax=Leptidea sinapis TaxID=189913 RepID=A0A5E4Q5W7_9NEOP|nr:unnamed protein product [Leptidea sinapis]
MNISSSRGSFRGSGRDRGRFNREIQSGPDDKHDSMSKKLLDIDMELELLKKKRAILQEEHQYQSLLTKENEFRRKHQSRPRFRPGVKRTASHNPGSGTPAKITKTDDIKKKDPDNCILRPNVETPKYVTGRLELALGELLKPLRPLYPNVMGSKLVRHVVRDRIRSIMMNKPVISLASVFEQYRLVYPEEAENDLVTLRDECKMTGVMKLPNFSDTETESISKYYFERYEKLLASKMDAMFNNIGKLQATDDKVLLKLIRDLKNTKTDDDSATGSDNIANIVSKLTKGNLYMNITELLVQKELSEMIESPKFKKTFLALVCYKDKIKDLNKIKLEAFRTMSKKCPEKRLRERKSTKIDKSIDEHVDKKESADENVDKEKNGDESEISNNKTVDKLEIDEVIEETKEEVTSKEGKNADQSGVEEAGKEKNVEINKESPVPAIGPYYVKVVGNPKLPSRAGCYKFLEQFKPSSIKKHKTIANLLIITFNEKESYNKIIAENEVAIEDCTLVIKSGDNNATPQTQPQKSTNTGDNTSSENAEDGKKSSIEKQDATDAKNFDIIPEEDEKIDESNGKTTEDGEKIDEVNEKTTEDGEQKAEDEQKVEATATVKGTCDDENIIKDVPPKDSTTNSKESVLATPTRSSTRLATGTPGSIRTRRASRLAQNNN